MIATGLAISVIGGLAIVPAIDRSEATVVALMPRITDVLHPYLTSVSVSEIERKTSSGTPLSLDATRAASSQRAATLVLA